MMDIYGVKRPGILLCIVVPRGHLFRKTPAKLLGWKGRSASAPALTFSANNTIHYPSKCLSPSFDDLMVCVYTLRTNGFSI